MVIEMSSIWSQMSRGTLRQGEYPGSVQATMAIWFRSHTPSWMCPAGQESLSVGCVDRADQGIQGGEGPSGRKLTLFDIGRSRHDNVEGMTGKNVGFLAWRFLSSHSTTSLPNDGLRCRKFADTYLAQNPNTM